MNIGSRIKTFFSNNLATGNDFGPSPEAKGLMVAGGVFAASTAAGYTIGRQHGINNYGPDQLIDVEKSYFVKTGTETYMGTCYGTTSGGESFTFQCAKVRDVGYNKYYTVKENAREHYTWMGAGIGAAVGAFGGIAAGVATMVLSRDSVY